MVDFINYHIFKIYKVIFELPYDTYGGFQLISYDIWILPCKGTLYLHFTKRCHLSQAIYEIFTNLMSRISIGIYDTRKCLINEKVYVSRCIEFCHSRTKIIED